MDPDNEIELEFPNNLIIYKSGRIKRLLDAAVALAAVDAATSVSSKDVTISPATGVAARLYLPKLTSAEKLPVLVYYHGGGYVVESAFSPTYHNYLNSLVARAHVVAVSVEYRLAPEHPLPASVDDSWDALNWAAAAGSDPWLDEHGDLSRLFLAGVSAGASISHFMAMRSGGVEIEGVVLVHPYFWGSEPVGAETRDPKLRGITKSLWKAVGRGGEDVDSPWLNVLAADAPPLSGLGCRRVLVCIGGKDLLKDRGRAYYERLVGSGWGGTAELMESEGEQHAGHLAAPASRSAGELMERIALFMTTAKPI